MSPGVAVTAMLQAAGWSGERGCSTAWHALQFASRMARVLVVAALSALMAVIRQTSGDGDGTHLVTSNAPIPGVTRNSHNSNRKLTHQTAHSPHRGARRSTARQFDLSPQRAEPTQKRRCRSGGHCQIRRAIR